MSDRKKCSAEERELEKLKRQLAKFPPTWEEAQYIRKWMRSQSNQAAYHQVLAALPPCDRERLPDSEVSAISFYQTFLPSDGHESALARLMVGATNAAMDCFARATTSDSPVRAIELNFASKLSRTVADLSKALDSHRGPDRPDFIDDVLPVQGDRGWGTAGGESELGGSAPNSSQERNKPKP